MALTSRAPFNFNQFRSFSLFNVEDPPPPPIVGSAAIVESGDSSVGVASSVALTGNVSALSALRGGPTSLQNRFRSRIGASFVQPAQPSAASIVEGSDIVVAFGSAQSPVLSSLRRDNLGPHFNAPFNVNQFKALRFSADSTPPGFLNALAFPTEDPDIAIGVGSMSLTGFAAIIESSDSILTTANIELGGTAAIVEQGDVPGSIAGLINAGAAAIVESSDIALALSIAGITGFAAILESSDVQGAQGTLTNTGSAAIQEQADQVTVVGSRFLIGSGAILESSDAPNVTVTASLTASAAIVEDADTAAATATASLTAQANIFESADSVSGPGQLVQIGTAAILENSDGIDIEGVNSAGGFFGTAAIVESADIAQVASGVVPNFFFRNAVITALSQSGIQGAASTYLELSACIVSAAYFDTNGAPYVPSQIQYEVNDLTTGLQLVPLTQLPVGTTNEIVITSQENRMVTFTREFEAHQIVLQITDGLGDVFYARTIFFLKRAPGLQ
jgi:hypothetical protein